MIEIKYYLYTYNKRIWVLRINFADHITKDIKVMF